MHKIKLVPYVPQQHRIKLLEIARQKHPTQSSFIEKPGVETLVVLDENDNVIGSTQFVITTYVDNLNIDQRLPWKDKVELFTQAAFAISDYFSRVGRKFWFSFPKRGHNVVCPKIFGFIGTKLTHKQFNVYANFGEE